MVDTNTFDTNNFNSVKNLWQKTGENLVKFIGCKSFNHNFNKKIMVKIVDEHDGL